MGLMNLTLPTVSVTLGPTWATQLNTALETIQSHDHTSGKGARIVPSAMNINANLTFNGWAATNLDYAALVDQSASLVPPLLVYAQAGDLYWNNGSGVPVQITDGGSVITTPANTLVLEYTAVAVDTIIGAGDSYVVYDVTTTSDREITLPLASSVAAGRMYVIKDASGLSETNPLTLSASGADEIDGAASQELTSDYGSWFVVGDGVSKWSII